MGSPLFYTRVITVLVLSLVYIGLDEVDCIVSQWDPFCQEETLYIPYVRIFQKGRHGAMLKDRGPGFIDVNGLQDIYICTNGLVMLYYSKPRGNGGAANGEIYEHGELHWAPHHCELYNPSGSAHGMDQPKKTLVSILLIGHPQDYRQPALQMFVAPTYDIVSKHYVNLTSLIMISSEGECILEKGVERARLRVRIKEPEPDPPLPEPTAWFCQLDSQRKLGQTGIINLYYHKQFPKYQETTLDEYDFGPEILNKKTGSAFFQRFKATEIDDDLQYTGKGQTLALDADRVYAALLNDRPIKFVGCLQYPDFSPTQFEILEDKATSIIGNTTAGIPELKLGDEKMYVPDENEPPFWAYEVDEPWLAVPSGTKEKRFALYANQWEAEDYKDAKAKVDTKKEELVAAIQSNVITDIDTKKQELKEEEMKFSLWPYREIYIAIQKYTIDLERALVDQWKLTLDTIDRSRTPGSFDVDINNISTYDAKTAGVVLPQLLRNLSNDLFDRRFDPYYPELATLYNDNISKLKPLRNKLRVNSIFVGPYISDAESFYSEYKLYKMLTKSTLTDFENAIKQMEKTKQPVPKPTFGMPYDKYFADSRIVISDARDRGDPSATPEENSDPGAKACYPLPTTKGTFIIVTGPYHAGPLPAGGLTLRGTYPPEH
ncbi:unnamed protein product [Orchesella dallaii]|uniref:Uncharacterized protein n=1 Tax=Orchesella dallaii TaxID=48710 RepID=A0ABP1RG89_9HEXA